MQVSHIAQQMGMPEEKVAQMMRLMKESGMDDAQMGFMMRTAVERGVERDDIVGMLSSLGVERQQVARVMRLQGLMDDEEARLFVERDRRQHQAAGGSQRPARRWAAGKKVAIVVFWLAVWQALDTALDNRLVLTGPVRVVQALAEQMVKPDFWVIAGASTGRIAAGFLLSFVVGLALALLAYRVGLVRDFIDPLMSLLRTIPVVSFIIMLLIWSGSQMLTVYLAFSIVLPLIYTNTLAGLESVDAQMVEMARVFRLGRWRTFMYVYRPALMPFLTSSSKISLGMSWKSGIMAEVLATPKPSIGKEMSQARMYLDTPDLFAWTVVVMVLSLAFEKAFLALLKFVGRPWGSLLGRGDEHAGEQESLHGRLTSSDRSEGR